MRNLYEKILLLLIIFYSLPGYPQNRNALLTGYPNYEIVYPSETLISDNKIKTIIDIQSTDSIVKLKVINKIDSSGKLTKRIYYDLNNKLTSTETYLYSINKERRIDSTFENGILYKSYSYTSYFNNTGSIVVSIDSNEINGKFIQNSIYVNCFDINNNIILERFFIIDDTNAINYLKDINEKEYINFFYNLSTQKKSEELTEYTYDKKGRIIKIKTIHYSDYLYNKGKNVNSYYFNYINDTLVQEILKEGNSKNINQYFFDKKNRITKYIDKHSTTKCYYYEFDNLVLVKSSNNEKIQYSYVNNLPYKTIKESSNGKEIREFKYEYY